MNLVEILKGVPECRLRLIEISWKLVGDEGKIDHHLLAFHSKEIKEAIKEAEMYQKATREAVKCLMEHFRP